MAPTCPPPLRYALALALLPLLGCQHRPAPATPTTTASVQACPDGMVRIAAGEFEAGDDPQRSFDPRPLRRERVARAFCIERTEVSVEAYRRCVTAGACTEPVPFRDAQGDGDRLCNWNRPGSEGHPVNCVHVGQARAYCAWSGHAGGPRRLPRELEWERAARGDTGRAFPWGDAVDTGRRANFCGAECERHLHSVGMPAVEALPGWTDSAAGTAPVDAFPEGATPEGVLNLAGNVGEFVDESFLGQQTLHGVLAPSESGAGVIVRGGSMLTASDRRTRASARSREVPTGYTAGAGIRCATDTR